jgi:polysaccharide biosynthesis PFTS motif protein
MMRGYRRLRASGQLERIARTREALTVTPIDAVQRSVSPLFFGAATEDAELAVREYILVRFGNLSLNRALLASLGEDDGVVTAPLPSIWRQVLEERGFRVARVRSAIAWSSLQMLYFGVGILAIARHLVSGLKRTISPPTPQGPFVHFDGLSAGTLPQPAADGRSYDVVSWYLQWNGRVRNVDCVHHGVRGSQPTTVHGARVVFTPFIVSPRGWANLARFLAWGIAASAISLGGLLTGRWWYPLLLNEAARAAAMRLTRNEDTAREYLFNNSAWVYRPLWTYEAERKGARISLYFYSTNTEGFRQRGAYPPVSFGYAAMNWPHYLVWDEHQADFIRRAVGPDAHVSVVGPIWFQGSPQMLPPLPPNTVAVFDVQPVRSSFYQALGLDVEYFVPSQCVRFLQDIADAAENAGVHVAFKRKREMGKLAHARYRRFVETYHERPHIVAVPPDVSAHRVIEQSAAVISMAFTSTALIGRDLGKPSVYYDPLGIIDKHDRAAHGIPVLTGPNELCEWLKSVRGAGEALSIVG